MNRKAINSRYWEGKKQEVNKVRREAYRANRVARSLAKPSEKQKTIEKLRGLMKSCEKSCERTESLAKATEKVSEYQIPQSNSARVYVVDGVLHESCEELYN